MVLLGPLVLVLRAVPVSVMPPVGAGALSTVNGGQEGMLEDYKKIIFQDPRERNII